MTIVLLTAFGVGGATAAGALIGFLLKKIPHKFNDILLGFAAGVMLAAAVFGLIIPSMEFGGKYAIIITVIGIMCGAFFLNLIDRFIPHLHNVVGVDKEAHPESMEKLNKILLFVAAIAIHNLPEGIAAGVSFGTGNISDAITVASGIAPEYSRRNDYYSTHDGCWNKQKKNFINCHGNRFCRSYRNFVRVFCRDCGIFYTTLCTGFCSRNYVICNQ